MPTQNRRIDDGAAEDWYRCDAADLLRPLKPAESVPTPYGNLSREIRTAVCSNLFGEPVE